MHLQKETKAWDERLVKMTRISDFAALHGRWVTRKKEEVAA